jgi:hypothetical protein
MWIAVQWRSRSRELGAVMYRIPGARLVRRRACERRVDGLLAELERRGVPAEDRPNRERLVDRWHRMVAGRCVSALFQVVPLMIIVIPYWRAQATGTSTTPLWIVLAVAAFGALSLTLMAADERAAAVSDPGGNVTAEAIRFLETLLVPGRRRQQESALDAHGRTFGRLSQALRGQARHLGRRMPSTAREHVRETTGQLIEALAHSNHQYLCGDEADRVAARNRLAWLVSSVLQHSCPLRDRRNSLAIVNERLLTGVPVADAAAEPFRNRFPETVGKLVVAVALFVGAAVFPGGGAISELMATAGLVSIALVCPPLREALRGIGVFRSGSTSAAGTTEANEEPQNPASSPPTACPECAERTAVTAGSRPVG